MIGVEMHLARIAELVENNELPASFIEDFSNLVTRASEENVGEVEPRRLYIATAWLPIGKISSHNRLLLAVAEGFQSLGFEVTFVVSGLEFTHHRGLTYYARKSLGALERVQRASFGAMRGSVTAAGLVFLTHDGLRDTSVEELVSRVYSTVGSWRVSSRDVVLHVSGGLSCPVLFDAFAPSRVRQLVLMMNRMDSVRRFRDAVDYCIVPARDAAMLSALESQGVDGSRVIARVFPFAPPAWQLRGDVPLSASERELLQRIREGAPDFVLVSMSARINSVAQAEWLSVVQRLRKSRPDWRIVHAIIGGSTEDLQGVVGDGHSSEQSWLIGLKWSENPYLLFKALAGEFSCV